jgi:preprotein translocase subunit SecY
MPGVSIAQLAAAETLLQRAADIAQIVTAGTSLLVLVSILLVARQVNRRRLARGPHS